MVDKQFNTEKAPKIYENMKKPWNVQADIRVFL